MPDNNDAIENAVVRVSPDLTGFRTKLIADLAIATKGVTAKVRIVADATGWRASIKEALAKNTSMAGGKPATAKVRLVASATGLQKSIDGAVKGKTAKVKVAVDKQGAKKEAAQAVDEIEQAATSAQEKWLRRVRRRRIVGQNRLVRNMPERVTRDQFRGLAEEQARQLATLRQSKDFATEWGKIWKDAHDADVAYTQAAENLKFRAVRSNDEKFQRDHERARDAAMKRDMARFRTQSEYFDHLRGQAETLDNQRNARQVKTDQNIAAMWADLAKFRHDNEVGLLDDLTRVRQQTDRDGVASRRALETIRISAIDTETRIEKNALKERENAERASLQSRGRMRRNFAGIEGPRIVDWGGQGVRPMNLLIGAAVALSPVLIAVSSSAIQASTSIAALGAAGIGAATGIVGLISAWSGVAEALKLAKSANLANIAKAGNTRAKAGVSSVSNTRQIAAAERSLADAQRAASRAQRDVNKVRVEAAQDLRDLREAVSDLALTESGAALDVDQARQDQAETNRNFWATELEKRQATQKVAEAEEKLSDIQRERRDKTVELAKAEKAGVNGSDKVVAAQERAADATRNVAEAQQALNAARARTAGTAGTAAVTVPASESQLKERLARMSQAGRDMVAFLGPDGPATKTFQAFQRRMETAILPGFLTFLKDVGADGKNANSTLSILADSAEKLGGIIGSTAAKLGEISKTAWFKGDLKVINTETEKSFKLIADALLILVKPFMTIFRESAPLLTRFSGWIKTIAEKFAAFIDKADKSGALTQWFKDAGDQMAVWGGIAKDLLRFLASVFGASLPTGQDLVSRIGTLVKTLADWSESDKGQKSIKDFFEFFRNIDYAKLGRLALQLTEMFLVWRTIKFVTNHPIATAIGILAAVDPATTEKLTRMFVDGFMVVAEWATANPVAAATILGIFGALKGASSLGVLKFVLPTSIPVPMLAVAAASIATLTIGALVTKRAVELGKEGETPAGSLKNLIDKPSWGNAGDLAVNLSPLGGLTNSITQIKEGGVSGLVENWRTQSTALMNEIGTWFAGLWPKIRGWLGELPGRISFFFGQMAGWIVVGIVKGIPALWEWLKTLYNDFQKWFYKTIADIAIWWSELPAKLAVALANLPATFSNIWSGVVDAVYKGINMAAGLIDKFLEGLDSVTKQFGLGVTFRIGPILSPQQAANFTANLAPQRGSASGHADGGPIAGNSAHNRADNIPAWLTANEWVMPVDSVQKYGSGFMRDVQTGQYADGGLVVPSGLKADQTGGPLMGNFMQHIFDWLPTADSIAQKVMGVGTSLFDTILSKMAGAGAGIWDKLSSAGQDILSALGVGGSGFLGGGTAVGDIGVARIAESTARSMGATNKQLVALIEAGIVESGMRNIPYGDRDSVGFLQQRAGWGSVAQRMDVAHATASFIRAAKAKDNGKYTAGQLAQAVQVSAFPARYDQREADAVAILNREAPGVPMGSNAAGAFGAWPSSPSAQRGDSGVWKSIVALVKSSGIPYQFGNAYRPGDPKWHGSGRAVDFMGFNQDPLAMFFAQRKPLELIHRTKRRDYAYTRGKDMGSFSESLMEAHRNHVHIAMSKGGRVPEFDSGGVLAPGLNVVANNTGGHEELRPPGFQRIDRRDIALLAAHIAQAMSGQTVAMDGRRVAEIVNGYSYVPQGV